MAYNTPFTTLTMNGTLAGGNEIFSCGIHLSYAGADYDDWVSWWTPRLEGLRDACQDMFSAEGSLTPFDAHLTSIKLADKDITGHYIGAALEIEADARGNNNQGYLPQGALVTTLVADKFKDPGKYNRFYLPIAAATLGGTWRLSDTQQNDYAAVMANFIGEINDVMSDGPIGVSPGVVVVSNTGTGSNLPVVAVRVGQIVDTQRRRRNALNEAYVTEPVVII